MAALYRKCYKNVQYEGTALYISKSFLPEGDMASALTRSSVVKLSPHICRKVFTLRQAA